MGAKPPPKSLESVCVNILILPTRNHIIFINFFLEKYTFVAKSEEEKVLF